MRAPLRVYVAGLFAGSRTLDADAAHYVQRVHRLNVGDAFLAFDPEAASEAEAEVTGIERAGSVRCEILTPRAGRNVGALDLTLLQCASKGDKLEEVVRAATALGVRRVAIAVSERSVAHPSEARAERWRSIAIDAARQSGRGDIPRIEGPLPLARWLSRTSELGELRLCLEPRAPAPLAECLAEWQPGTRGTLLIGPEGGFSEQELGAAEQADFRFAALGPLTLRTELAAVAALGCFVSRLPGRLDTL